MHLSEKAVEPPGEARADLDIFLDYARRMDFRDQDGEPLIKWTTPKAAFEAWKECSRGPAVRLHRAELREAARRQRHPVAVHGEAPDGTERLYADGRFNTDPDYCESYGHDLRDRARRSREAEYRAKEPRRPRVPARRRLRARRPRCRPTSTRCC